MVVTGQVLVQFHENVHNSFSFTKPAIHSELLVCVNTLHHLRIEITKLTVFKGFPTYLR